MKKYIIFTALFFVFSSLATAQLRYEAGIGSGFVFYGDDDLKDFLNDFDQSGQVILCGNVNAAYTVANAVSFTAGIDSIFDGRWKGGSQLALWDYCAFAGFDVYPGVAGLFCTVNYCLGRRTDFIGIKDTEDTIQNTDWGNGFKFGVGYTFGFGSKGLTPKVSADWRHMPRGGKASDNIVTIRLGMSW